MLQRLLIANRGEIACRIIRTARRMGITTVAVHSDVDASALHVRMADEALSLGGAAPSESYLRAGRILALAKEAVRMRSIPATASCRRMPTLPR